MEAVIEFVLAGMKLESAKVLNSFDQTERAANVCWTQMQPFTYHATYKLPLASPEESFKQIASD